ncbi:UNVERIFIED_CONTAM: hypothetical protein PYX00_011695 [Menopon gallinae]|uniref:Pyruvate dehydrogenase E1 component subunit beta n=1 Tax=Menopon gallinae TaxID=328185 RepID=A0AAW2H8E0_9NEOP
MDGWVTVSEVINRALDEELCRDRNVILLGEEVAKSGGAHQVTRGLLAKHGNFRVMDAPISEMGFTGFAAGAAFLGLRPVVEFMTWNFALQSIDHIINSCAKTRYMSGGRVSCPVVFRGPNGYNPGYAAQHTQDFSAYYGCVPGLKVVSPYSARDHYGLTKAAIRDENPVVILENESMYGDRFEVFPEYATDYCQDLGRAVVERPGRDVTLVGASIAVKTCLDAAEALAGSGISCEVVNLVAIRPLDRGTVLSSVAKTRRAVVVDFGWPAYGVASEVAAVVGEALFGRLLAPVVRVCGEDVPTPYAANLEALSFPTVAHVLRAVRSCTEYSES